MIFIQKSYIYRFKTYTTFRYYHQLESEVDDVPSSYLVGSILFETDDLKLALKEECKSWKRAFGAALNEKAGEAQEEMLNFIDNLSKRMRLVSCEQIFKCFAILL